MEIEIKEVIGYLLVIDDNKQAIYFDSYGLEPPKEIKNLIKSNQYKIGNTTKVIQSL